MTNVQVSNLTCSRINLKTSFDHISRGCKACSRATSDGTSQQHRGRRHSTILLGEHSLHFGVHRKVNRREGDVTQQTRSRATIQPEEAQFTHHLNCRAWSTALAGHLQTNLDDLERVGEHHLTGTGTGSGEHLEREIDTALVEAGEGGAEQVVDGEFDGLLGRDAHQLWPDAAVETARTFASHHLHEAVGAVAVELLYARTGVALVLHARLHQIDRIDHRGADATCERAQHKVQRAVLGGGEQCRGGPRRSVHLGDGAGTRTAHLLKVRQRDAPTVAEQREEQLHLERRELHAGLAHGHTSEGRRIHGALAAVGGRDEHTMCGRQREHQMTERYDARKADHTTVLAAAQHGGVQGVQPLAHRSRHHHVGHEAQQVTKLVRRDLSVSLFHAHELLLQSLIAHALQKLRKSFHTQFSSAISTKEEIEPLAIKIICTRHDRTGVHHFHKFIFGDELVVVRVEKSESYLILG
mmetsp:Transcript_17814/g.53492  ORF Transcript_17814/g.53492 Transcript_17814/m.53492 type:complete len:468 (-) Transcript_17814:659-2062(-)